MPEPVRADQLVNYTGRVSPNQPDRPGQSAIPVPPGGCPVNALARQTLASAHALTRMLRRLRISMIRCCACPSGSNCPILVQFNAQLSDALQEVADEWQLA